jgi:hypothetical protein
VNNAIVSRDQNGGFNAGQITAANFVGGGFGLTNVPNSATTATPAWVNSAIVSRDQNGGFSAGQIFAANFAGGGFGLTNVPNSATTATSTNTPNAIVARDVSGNFSANFINANNISADGIVSSGLIDFSAAITTAPVRAVLSVNTPATCYAGRELLIKSDATPGQQLFICNAAGNGYLLVGDGIATGVTSVAAGDASVSIGGTTAAPTVEVANGGITSVKLAPNAVVGSIADGSLTPAKIAGTAATLGANNTFSGSQTIQQSLSVGGAISAGTASINGPLTASNPAGTGIHGDGSVGIDASTSQGVGLQVRTTGNSQGATAATLTSSQIGTLISGRIASNAAAGYDENFKVDTYGAVTAASVSAQFVNGGSADLFMPVKLAPNSTQVVPTAAGDKTGAVGIVTDKTSTMVRVAYGGLAECRFDSAPLTIGDYVGISTINAGFCGSLGSQYPNFPGVQVIGRIVVATANMGIVLVFGPERYSAGSVYSISTGAGLFGGPITGNGFIGIAAGGVTNSMLQNNFLSINPGAGLSGGGAVSLGGSTTLNIANAGVSNGMLQNSYVQVLPGEGMSVTNGGTLYLGSSVKLSNTGVLSFNGRSGNILPAPGDYSFGQIGGTVIASQLPAGVVFNNASNTFSSSQTINGSLSVIDSAPSGGIGFSAASQNNPAGVFTSNGPTILVAGNAVRGVFNLDSAGNLNVAGAVTGTSLSGDGSALTNVNASSVGGVVVANLATTSALSAETATRQSGETTLQNNINSEAANRQSADAGLQTNINAETAGRQSDVANLQTSINNVSVADAKLASANTFTASNTFTAGTQDFSAAGATLPVRALPSAQTPVSCVAGKELLIKTDAVAGQQLFICDASGTTWNLVGDGAGGGVTSFNGRNGSVSPNSGDYSFSQLSGSAAPSQLPANLVYNNQVNTFSASQTVNGNLSAISFSGNGGGLSNINAALLNNLPSSSFAQLATNNTFNGSVTATGFSGNGSGLTSVNASTVNNLQMLKVTASITPSSVGVQSCSEQAFAVSGINAGDTLLVVSQPSSHSPGANIAIGGWRASAANTVSIQFCNVGRSASTPVAGTYTFALMR